MTVGLGGAERGGAALRGDGLYDEIDARLRGRRLSQRRTERERDRGHENRKHDFLLVALLENIVGLRLPLSRSVSNLVGGSVSDAD